jgi:hypothetical protein
VYDIVAEPVTDKSAADTEPATREPANAVNPTFFSLFILSTPYLMFNIKQSFFIKNSLNRL